MHRASIIITSLVFVSPTFVRIAGAANFTFFGRSGDAIEINLGALPGVSPSSTFSALNTSGFSGHTVLTSDTLLGQSFASTGRLWVFANPARNTPATGDSDPAARGFQGFLSGSLLVNGVTKTFSVTVRPGYTGSGAGSVGQSSERIDDPTNNPLFVAQQQQRLRYLGFVPQGGTPLAVDGDFGPLTDSATRTFQAAFVGGYNTTQADVDGIIGPNTAGWLNAANAPTWSELIDPDPQPPGSFSTSAISTFTRAPIPAPATAPGSRRNPSVSPRVGRTISSARVPRSLRHLRGAPSASTRYPDPTAMHRPAATTRIAREWISTCTRTRRLGTLAMASAARRSRL
jgi:hypothetical protein